MLVFLPEDTCAKALKGRGVGETRTCGWITRVREAGGEW